MSSSDEEEIRRPKKHLIKRRPIDSSSSEDEESQSRTTRRERVAHKSDRLEALLLLQKKRQRRSVAFEERDPDTDEELAEELLDQQELEELEKDFLSKSQPSANDDDETSQTPSQSQNPSSDEGPSQSQEKSGESSLNIGENDLTDQEPSQSQENSGESSLNIGENDLSDQEPSQSVENSDESSSDTEESDLNDQELDKKNGYAIISSSQTLSEDEDPTIRFTHDSDAENQYTNTEKRKSLRSATALKTQTSNTVEEIEGEESPSEDDVQNEEKDEGESCRPKRPFERLFRGLAPHATDPDLTPEEIFKEFRILRYEDSKSGCEYLEDDSAMPLKKYKCQCKKSPLRYLFYMINMKKKDAVDFIVGKY